MQTYKISYWTKWHIMLYNAYNTISNLLSDYQVTLILTEYTVEILVFLSPGTPSTTSEMEIPIHHYDFFLIK